MRKVRPKTKAGSGKRGKSPRIGRLRVPAGVTVVLRDRDKQAAYMRDYRKRKKSARAKERRTNESSASSLRHCDPILLGLGLIVLGHR